MHRRNGRLSLKFASPEEQKRLLASLVTSGQQMPIVVVAVAGQTPPQRSGLQMQHAGKKYFRLGLNSGWWLIWQAEV